MSSNMQVAQTILNQLGGPKIAVMIGAKGLQRGFYALENGLQFGFGLNNQMNRCIIKLNASDLYDVEFWKIGKKTCKKVKEFNDVYNDMLVDIFESTTGLYLSM